ncbi:MAG: PhnD/SsuA/transferrin family substrate-binding protein [Polyangiaceae bacterium]|nr:PhnD/SsuA/transferrin family substrate-binding protein [Polyangiaceae bacterium]MCL4750796.1 PhnD/SsuA/transferrin family substrate-binding protein [Myxococcales bacterium]
MLTRRPRSGGTTWSRRRLLAGGCALLGVLGCGREEPDVRVDLSRRGEPEPSVPGPTLRFAVGTMLSPRETARAYRQLGDYLESRTGHRVEVVQRRGYSETNALLDNWEADFGFVCTGAYVALKGRAELLAVPVVGGKSTYASLIVARKSDPARDVTDLAGDRFAYVDPLSLSGRIYPEWFARKAAGGERAPFSETVYSHSHTGSVDLVTSGRVRAAGVDSLIFEQLAKSEPGRVESLRVLHRSPEFGIPPFVAGPKLTPALRALLRTALLEAHLHPAGTAVLDALGFERFASGDPKAYEGVAAMHRAVVVAGGFGTP